MKAPPDSKVLIIEYRYTFSIIIVTMSSVTKIMQNRKQYKISLLIFNTEVKPGLLKVEMKFR